MKKLLTAFIFCSGMVFDLPSFALGSSVNHSKVEIRPIAHEPELTSYSISVTDQTKVKKPPFSYFTELNPSKPLTLYNVPPFPHTKNLPTIGNWMIAVAAGQKKTTYVPAHWLNYQDASGRYIIEPINYIFVVYSENENKASDQIVKVLNKIGFTSKWSSPKYHSDNYHAYIGEKLTQQLKNENDIFLTFSNNFWMRQNDHLRVMGPFKTKIDKRIAYLFVSSASEESSIDSADHGHYYVSFNHARSNLASAFIEHGFPTYYVLSRNIVSEDKEFTGDHDGYIFITVINSTAK